MAEQTFPPPSQYAEGPYGATDPAAIVRQYPFATLISPDLHVTLTPVIFEHDDSEATMIGHMARRNPHAEALADGQVVLAVFNGPHTYISPRWYAEKLTVPTWDYISARMRGILEPIDDDASQLTILRRTIALMESHWADPWTMEAAPEGKVEELLPMIRSFRIHVKSIDGTTKLNQTHPAGDRQRVIDGLSGMPGVSDAHAIADLMRALPEDIPE
jgi:transcriptional regulator